MTKGILPLLLALLAAGAAQAETDSETCADHAAVAARLAEGWGESRQSIALGADGAVVETWASADTGTWTITVTRPGELTCLVASGDAWEAVTEPLDLSEGA